MLSPTNAQFETFRVDPGGSARLTVAQPVNSKAGTASKPKVRYAVGLGAKLTELQACGRPVVFHVSVLPAAGQLQLWSQPHAGVSAALGMLASGQAPAAFQQDVPRWQQLQQHSHAAITSVDPCHPGRHRQQAWVRVCA